MTRASHSTNDSLPLPAHDPKAPPSADPAAVRAQLERVLTSPTFAGAERLSRFLRFTVEQVLEGKGDRLKEYVLGVEVFDRDERYDPRLDSIVRVEARRLRAKLAEYYETAGATDALIFRLPKGSYVPHVSDRAVDAAPAAAERVVGPRTARPRRWLAAAIVLTVVAIAGVLAVRWGRDTARAGGTGMAMAVLPFVDHGGAPPHLADRLTDGLIGELTRTSGLSVRSRTSVMQFQGVRRPMRDIARALDAQVVMEGSVAVEGGRLIVEARLVDAVLDRKLWAEEFEGAPGDLRALQRRIAAAATASLRRAGL